MAIEFELVDHQPIAGPELTLVRVEFRPIPGEPVHSNIFHMQLYPTGRRLLIDGLGRHVTESGILVPPLPDGLFPDESPVDPFQREDFARNNDAEMVANIEAYWERKLRAAAEGRPYPQHHRSTLNLQVGASADDADEADDNTNFDSVGAAAFANSNTTAASRYNEGARFTSVTIGQGDTIDAATMQDYIYNTTFGHSNVDIHAEDVDNAVDFSTTADVTDRIRTAASVAWVEDIASTGFATSPEIKTVIQEIVDRGSWSSGNALVLLSIGKSDTNNEFRIRSYDWVTTDAQKLDIDFTAGGAAVLLPQSKLIGQAVNRASVI